MHYGYVLAVLGLVLAAWPVQADPLNQLFDDDLSRFTDPTPLVNGPFIGVSTRLKVATALKQSKADQLVVSGSEVQRDPHVLRVCIATYQPDGLVDDVIDIETGLFQCTGSQKRLQLPNHLVGTAGARDNIG